MAINVREIKKGSQLRELRQSLQMSQETFANSIGYKLNRISVIERKDLDVPPKVSKALASHIKLK